MGHHILISVAGIGTRTVLLNRVRIDHLFGSMKRTLRMTKLPLVAWAWNGSEATLSSNELFVSKIDQRSKAAETVWLGGRRSSMRHLAVQDPYSSVHSTSSIVRAVRAVTSQPVSKAITVIARVLSSWHVALVLDSTYVSFPRWC